MGAVSHCRGSSHEHGPAGSWQRQNVLLLLLQAAAKSPSAVKGLVLLNCAVGMNSKAAVDDWRIVVLYPILVLIDILLKVGQGPSRVLSTYHIPLGGLGWRYF